MKDSHRHNRYRRQTRGQWQVNRERFGLGAEQPPYPEGDSKPFAEFVPDVLDAMHLGEHARLTSILNVWPDIAGTPLCRIAIPSHLQDGCLTLRLTHPALLMELRGPMQAELLRRLQERFTAQTVATLRLRVE